MISKIVIDAELIKKYCSSHESIVEVTRDLLEKGHDISIVEEAASFTDFLKNVIRGEYVVYYSQAIKHEYLKYIDKLPQDLLEYLLYIFSNENLAKEIEGSLSYNDLEKLKSTALKDKLIYLDIAKNGIVISTIEDIKSSYKPNDYLFNYYSISAVDVTQIKEIHENAEALSEKTKDTPFENETKKVKQISQELLHVRDPISLEKGVKNLENALIAICNKMPKRERREVSELLKQVKNESFIDDKFHLMAMVLSKISSQMEFIKIFYTVIGGNLIMGDEFKNIQNATIINKAIVIDSFNKVKKEYDEDVAKALLQIGEFIEKSGDVSAGILFDKFNEELNKPQTEKVTLGKIWRGIEKTLPSIVNIADVVAKLAPLF